MSQGVGSVPAVLLPPRCPLCGAPGSALCRGCVAGLRPPPPLPPLPEVDRLAALVAYDDAGRALVAAVKFRNERALLGRLGVALATLVRAEDVRAVTWAPTTPPRRRRRGYDQAELLARAVARAAGAPARPLLRRHPGPAQTGRRRADRLAGPAFRATRPPPATVVLVDDVVTTGATVAAAAGALREAGAGRVVALAVAATPPPPPLLPHAGAAWRGGVRPTPEPSTKLRG